MIYRVYKERDVKSLIISKIFSTSLMPTMDKIAVIGISVELPSGSGRTSNLDHESLFQFLLNQEEAFEPIPPERLNLEAYVP